MAGSCPSATPGPWPTRWLALLADPAAAAKMAEAGHGAVERVLGADALVDATEELYRSLLRRR